MNVIEEIEKEQLEKLAASRPIPEFSPGDNVRVNVKVVEGTRERVQVFEGVCIARKNRGLNSSFTVRKISYGEGVERVFPLYSPGIAGIEVVRRGRVRRAKLYYLRGRSGKAARIAERADRFAPTAEQEAVLAEELGGLEAPEEEAKTAVDDAPEEGEDQTDAVTDAAAGEPAAGEAEAAEAKPKRKKASKAKKKKIKKEDKDAEDAKDTKDAEED